MYGDAVLLYERVRSRKMGVISRMYPTVVLSINDLHLDFIFYPLSDVVISDDVD